MITEIHDALRESGASEQKMRLPLLHWQVGIVMAALVALVVCSFFGVD